MSVGPVLKYPGSKHTISNWIIEHMPPHQVYLEPYFGSGGVFFAKAPASVETINDIDNQVVNLFKVIRDRPEELAHLVYWTPWARKEYKDLLTSARDKEYFKTTGDPAEDARRFLVRMWMAMGAKTSDRSGWRNNIRDKVGKYSPKIWRDVPERILQVAARLKDTQIECMPAVDLIQRYRYPEVLIYADPPYVLGTRREKRQYKNEMTDDDHVKLLELLENHPGPVLLSGYDNPLYNDRLKHWIRKTTRSMAEGGRTREEVLWINQKAAEGMAQQTLF